MKYRHEGESCVNNLNPAIKRSAYKKWYFLIPNEFLLRNLPNKKLHLNSEPNDQSAFGSKSIFIFVSDKLNNKSNKSYFVLFQL